ncbi:MAG: YebC/PmpR family DNA-binding transcriptional regulator [Candidatus Uhrbacteria bacterium]|nr:YebC/PmpR family DNA-binding transcriptional regulator [Candidatus Uhrbacteria bacterium]
MSRHSKWSKVKQFKGAIDAKRSASFTKLAHEITVAVREKGSDPGFNVRLRFAIERAKKGLMPKENIERAIKRGTGENVGDAQIEQPTYEAYGPGGSALVIECMTDNRNRSVADVKTILTKNGGTFASSGAVTHLFSRTGVVRAKGEVNDEIELSLIESGAIDITKEDEEVVIKTSPQDLMSIATTAEQKGLAIESAQFEWVPNTLIDVDEETGLKIEALIEALEENDDVNQVYSNVS